MEPTFKNVGLILDALCLVLRISTQIFLHALGFRTTTKVFINTSFLLPSALSIAAFLCKIDTG